MAEILKLPVDELERIQRSYVKCIGIVNAQRERIDELKQALRDVIDVAGAHDRKSGGMFDHDPHPNKVCNACGGGGYNHTGSCIVGRAQQLLNKKDL